MYLSQQTELSCVVSIEQLLRYYMTDWLWKEFKGLGMMLERGQDVWCRDNENIGPVSYRELFIDGFKEQA